jgi:hypothetical protein
MQRITGVLLLCLLLVGLSGLTPGRQKVLFSSGGYQGPGDIIPGAKAFYGLRAYTKNYATGSNPAIDIVDGAGTNQVTINILSSGYLDESTLNGWIASHSTAHIKKLYDQSGNSLHMTQATVGNMPTITQNAMGNHSAMTCTAASSQDIRPASFSVNAQPLTTVTAAKRTLTATDSGILGSDTPWNMGFGVGANNVRIFATTAVTTTNGVSDNTWLSFQALFNGVSSKVYVKGVQTTGLSPGTNGTNANTAICSDRFGNFFNGLILEVGLWAGDNSSKFALMESNIRNAWGF